MPDATLRRVEPLPKFLAPDLPANVDPGKIPELRWVAPTDLYVDETYQRSLRDRSLKLIARIIKGFLWRKLKPPIVVETDSGLLHCIDGQHTAIAAATLKVQAIPVFIVEALTVEERADAFVGHNRDRIVMDPLDVYKGLLLAKDPDAVDCHNVCTRAGVRIKQLQPRAKIYVGECSSVGVIANLIKRHGVMKARKVLEALVKGERAPIRRVEIDAVEAMMLVSRPNITIDQMAAAIRGVGDHGVIQSKVEAVTINKPQKYSLFNAYAKILEKQKENHVETI